MKLINKNLLILAILYSIFSVVSLILAISIANNNIFILLLIFSLVIISLVGVWLFSIGKSNSALILFKIYNYLTYIIVMVVLSIIILLILTIQDLVSSCSNIDVTPIKRITIIWPVILLMVYSTITMVGYNRFYTKIKKKEVSKKLSWMVVSFNFIYIVLILINIVFSFSDLPSINILLIISELLYIAIKINSIYIIFNKYLK